MEIPIVQLAISSEHDTVTVRRLAQHVAELAGFAAQDLTRIATAVSEIARNALQYAGGGRAVCSILTRDRRQYLKFVLSDDGPGIENLPQILDGTYRSRTGMGVGISGSRKLVELFDVQSSPGAGTVVTLGKELPPGRGPVSASMVEQWASVLTSDTTPSSVEEARRSSIDMMRSLNVLKHKEAELSQQLTDVERLNRELKTAQKKLQQQATVDALTGLQNRRAVLDELRKELVRARRTGQPLSVAMVDLDHFKLLNDTRGHLAGDAALKETARRMLKSVRDYDSVGRYGGEEFLIVLPGCDSPSAEALAERLRSAVCQAPMVVDEGTAEVTCSIGVTTSSTDLDVESLIDVADAALYRAKERGRNRVELATRGDVERVVKSHRSRGAGSAAGTDDR
jgi:diguanylate cyclase (GGDEF)-like protein